MASERNDSENQEIDKNNNKNMAIKFNNMKKYPIYNVSFNLENNDLMLSWTIKSISNIIKAFNIRNYGRFQKTTNAHQNKIDCLKYNNNSVIDNKEFIISFSAKDNYLIIYL